MFEKVDEIIDRRAKYYGLHDQIEAARICFEAKRLYTIQLEPISFKNGILTVSVKKSTEAQELQFKEKEVIKKLNQKIGQEVVKHLKFRLKT